MKDDAKLEKSYQDIIDRQAEFEVELANNADFEAWTISDWPESYMYKPFEPEPVWDDEVRASFSNNLRSYDQFDRAIGNLVWWRSYYGLETMVMFRRRLDEPYFPPSSYQMCSANTQELAELLSNFTTYNCCDDRPMDFYPLLDRIVAWIDATYTGA